MRVSEWRGRTVARELGLAGLIAAVTWASAQVSFDFAWTSAQCAPESPWIWLLIAGTALLGLLRLRLPGVALVGAAALFGAWPAAGSLLALTVFHASTHIQPTRRLRAVLGLAVLTDCGAALLSAQYGWPIVVVGHAVALAVCIGLPVGGQFLLRKADRLVSALRERTHYLEDNYRLAHSTARLQERSRIAQEMHDQLGHRLSLISLYAGALELTTAGKVPKATDEARLIRSTVHTAMQELRGTLGILRTAEPDQPQLQPVDETGTPAGLARLIAQSRSAGVPVELTWRGADLADAPPAVRWAVHRIVRECLTNIHRHAVGAAANVVIERDPERVRVEVTSGSPIASEPRPAASGTGLGLVGVQERIRLLNGDFRAGSTPDGGFRVSAGLPLVGSAPPDGFSGPWPGVPNGRIIHPAAGTGQAGGGLRGSLRDGRGVAALLAVGLVGVPALVSVVLNAASLVVPGSTPFDAPVESARIGMTKTEVISLIGEDDPLARMAAQTIEKPPPPGATCLYSQTWSEATGTAVLRYCFQGDRLSLMDRLAVPASPEGP
ncbi:two-component sensor histidine kinase [Actinoplanes sp. ATCC 53533]|uniref:sensor histidine kinase n=1 Tax=Actinoplanes sp. ATCC 53533 TaxID=1288362 RepID=UPI000F7733DB|nr:histidine kinase [Actinoplanes sp. ATCC 53533]RSM62232.1 two-component sensor histidine kinase [Actinoplanes sp. ATCC 53533]